MHLSLEDRFSGTCARNEVFLIAVFVLLTLRCCCLRIIGPAQKQDSLHLLAVQYCEVKRFSTKSLVSSSFWPGNLAPGRCALAERDK